MAHRVREGEHVVGLAVRHGLPFSAIWDHSENAKLREQRPNPNVLLPGDRLFIPEPEARVESCEADQAHTFIKTTDQLYLRLDVTDLLGRDVAGSSCELHLRSEVLATTIGNDGIVEAPIPANLKKAKLVVEGFSYPILIGEIDPVDEPSGQRERLRNLGFFLAGDQDEYDPSVLADALYLFQLKHDLKPTGEADEATRDMLVAVHGT